MNIHIITAPDRDQPSEQDEKITKPTEVEKGSGYSAPNEGSGESVTEEDLSPDAEPIPGAGLAQHSDSSGE